MYVSFEFACMILSLKASCKAVLVNIYRKQEIPFSIFCDEWTCFIEEVIEKGDTILVVGDLNLWVDVSTNKEAKDFVSLMNTYGLQQVVEEPTHKSGHTLDQIYTNPHQMALSYEVIHDTCGVSSDHFPILIQIPVAASNQANKMYWNRNIKGVDVEQFRNDISHMCDNAISNSFTDIVEYYLSEGKRIMDNHAPLKCKKVKSKGPPWMDTEYIKSRALRRKFEKQWRHFPSKVNRNNYIQQKRLCCSMSMEKQKQYYTKVINNCESQKDLFKVANDILDKTKERVLPPFTDPIDLANQFNKFYIDKVVKIRESIPVDCKDISQYSCPFEGIKLNSFRPTTCVEVEKLIKEFGLKTSQEDPIPSFLLTSCLDIILPLFVDIVNKSLSEGCMDGIKESVITPLLKKAGLDYEQFKNFRPVNTLLFLSKLTERVVLVRLNEHMSLNNLHESSQFGYKKFHSTETMILGLTDEVLRGFDENLVTVMIVVDLSAAFDTLDPEQLVQILRTDIGIEGVALKWFHSFLTNRTQKVKIDNQFSECRNVPCGVPQGSVLGPVLFNINVKSQPQVFRTCSLTTSSFADDSNGRKQFSLSFQFNVLTRDIPSCMKKIVNWSNANSFKINPDKTEIIVMCPSSLNDKVIIKGIFFENQCIRFSSKLKNVGVVIDKNLKFDSHVNTVVSHCYALIKDVRRIRDYLKREDLEKLVHAIISHRLDYCNSIYLNISKKNIQKLQKCQNSAARLIMRKTKADCSKSLLNELHWLPIEVRIVYKVILIVFKVLNGQCSSVNLTRKNTNLRNGTTMFLETPNFKTKYGKRIFEYSGSRYWNALPMEIKTTENINKFKKLLKTLLFTEFDNIKKKAFKYKSI